MKSSGSKQTTNGRYAWQGSLSLYKGCDGALAITELKKLKKETKVSYGGRNPGVFTDGACYIPWIAEQYGLQLDPAFTEDSKKCAASVGDKLDVNSTRCLTNRNTHNHTSFCVFDEKVSVYEITLAFKSGSEPLRIVFDKCKLFAVEGYVDLIISEALNSIHSDTLKASACVWIIMESLLAVPITALEWILMLW